MAFFDDVSRRTFITGASGTFVAAVNPGSSAVSGLLIRAPEVVTVTDRGASIAGLRSALREIGLRGGGTVKLQAPSFRIDTAELLASGPIEIPPSTTIEGGGVSLLFHGTAIAPPLFITRDASQVALRNISAVGNGRAVIGANSGAFARFEMSASALGDIEDIRLENIRLSGFGGERWIQFLQHNPSGRRLTGLRITDLRASGGSSLSPAAIGVAAAPLWIYGIEGEIEDVEIRRLSIEAQSIKQGVVLFHKVRNATLDSVTVLNAGLRGATDDAAGYAIMAYANPDEMRDIAILSPVVRNPRSVGIYLRGAQNVRIVNPVISGQSDLVAVNLPKGAIALDGSSNVSITGGNLSGNAFDLSVADGGVNALDLNVRGLTTTGSRTSVILVPSPGKGAISGARFFDCNLSASQRVFRVMNEQVRGRYYNDVWILGGTIRSATAGNAIELTQGEITSAGGYRIEDVKIQANNVAIMAAGLQGSLSIRRTTIEGLGNLNYGIVADDCPRMDWDDITFRNIAAGYGYAARSLRRSAKGNLRQLRFVAVGRQSARASVPITR